MKLIMAKVPRQWSRQGKLEAVDFIVHQFPKDARFKIQNGPAFTKFVCDPNSRSVCYIEVTYAVNGRQQLAIVQIELSSTATDVILEGV